jgi:hypothetical protein
MQYAKQPHTARVAARESFDGDAKARWLISPPALYLLEQVFKMEHFPSLHMRQRLAADLNVSARQVRGYTPRARAPPAALEIGGVNPAAAPKHIPRSLRAAPSHPPLPASF